MKKIYLITALFCSLLYTNSFSQQQLNVTLLGRLTYNLQPGTRLSNIGGYVDAQSNEYALVGHPDGLSIVNVTDPVNPFQAFMVPSAGMPGTFNNWREVKTMGNYAYVVTEAGGGLQIINLTNLPNNYQVKTWTGDGPIAGMLDRAHALHIDGNHVYIYGTTSIANGGIVSADISDPWNPTFAGVYTDHYVHDGYVRADTVYAVQIYEGTVAVIDVSNKANPQVVNTFSTPTAFPHNTWLSDDSKTLFTTDENSGSFLAAFDVSDKMNITELDRIQSYAGNGSVVHNTHILNDYAVNSWYADGITIVDAARPDNLIEVGYYDVSFASGPGFNGVWGVYPYLPSGNLVVTERDSGLYILAPTYVRGAYLEGNVTDSITGSPLSNVIVEILSTTASDISKITGNYKTGIAIAGSYSVKFSRSGYQDKIISNVTLNNGVLTILDAALVPTAISVEEIIDNDDFLIYPNPAKDKIKIVLPDYINKSLNFIYVCDATGKIIISSELNSNSWLDVSTLTKGIYTVTLMSEGKILQKKFIKE